MKDVSEESLLDYFYSTGGSSGRLRNADILKTFKPFIGHGDSRLRAKYREEFKLIIDRIAVVKSENGEKYLVLKKKYRQILHERDSKHECTSPGRAAWDATDPSASSPPQKEPYQPMPRADPDGAAEDQQTGRAFTQQDPLELPVPPAQEPSAQNNGSDVLDKDSGSKSEAEQDEESTGSLGSATVALDPIEKEWMYSAAGARVPDLSHLLRQDPSLANKKDFTSAATATILHKGVSFNDPRSLLEWTFICIQTESIIIIIVVVVSASLGGSPSDLPIFFFVACVTFTSSFCRDFPPPPTPNTILRTLC
ncbi:ankyrin repeat domain-containing protein SOWAHC isoform X1 [Pungitius pungitius]|uniref:ankyrin repeat domain-containing protein SOWAHC isoform X1 n=1 Tax=Pungitius pungitius TaxID=134920 RepID=UPI002E11D66D